MSRLRLGCLEKGILQFQGFYFFRLGVDDVARVLQAHEHFMDGVGLNSRTLLMVCEDVRGGLFTAQF